MAEDITLQKAPERAPRHKTDAAQNAPRPRKRRLRRFGTAIAAPVLLLVLWQLGSALNLIDSRVIPPPSEVVEVIWEMLLDGTLIEHLQATIGRFVVGLVVGGIPGAVLGMVFGVMPRLREFIWPLVSILYTVPRIALFPLFLILVGLNESSNILTIAIGPFFIMIITVTGGVRQIDPLLLDVARSFETGRLDLFRRVTLPGAMPSIMDGLRVALGYALLGTTAVEFLVAETGVGALIWRSWTVLDLTLTMVGIVCISVVGWLSFVVLDFIQRLVTPWRTK